MPRWTREQLEDAVANSVNLMQVLRHLNLSIQGGNTRTVKKYITQYNLDISHFTFQLSSTSVPVEEYLRITAPQNTISSHRLKQELIKNGQKEHRCECCGLSEWLDEPISLELHHINGIRHDNRLENLQILCPNCHSKTDNYKNRNKSTHKYTRPTHPCIDCGKDCRKTSTRCRACSSIHQRKVERPDYKTLTELRSEYTLSEIGNMYGVTGDTVREWIFNYEWSQSRRTKCNQCGSECDSKHTGLCWSCYTLTRRKTTWPTYQELLDLMDKYPMTTIGKMYGVSDNAVRKWLKKYQQENKE